VAVYDDIGRGYAGRRRPDPRIARLVAEALGDARLVLNVGAGAGSYEPHGSEVVALDLSATMLAQRPSGAGPSVLGTALRLPFPDDSFDAVMAVLTVHHWDDRLAGYAELRRVARRQVVLTYEPAVHNRMWLVAEYLPEIAALDEHRPGFCTAEVAEGLGGGHITTVAVPHGCTDGFIMAFWGRPEAFLDPATRRATSGFSMLEPEVVERSMTRLAADLASGAWDRRHGHLRHQAEYDAGLRLVVADRG
jgi:SAM-dependent methyltransferase